MNKIYLFLYSLATCLLLAACADESVTDASGEHSIQSLNASLADLTLPRTHLENETSVVWDQEDMLGVFTDTQNNITVYTYSAQENNGAIFTGDKVSGHTFYAFYPYAEKIPDGTKITSTLQPEFSYKAETYARQCPMVAKSTDNNFKFLQTCGMIKLSLTGSWKISSITLAGNNKEILAGTGTIDAAADAPLLEIPTTSEDASTVLTMHASEVVLNQEKATSFYFIVPPQTFPQGLTFTIRGYTADSDQEKAVTKSTAKQINVSRATIKSFTAIDTDNLLAEEEPAGEREALMAIYNALGGSKWKNHNNWGSNKDLSKWHGVRIEDNHVVRLYLGNNNLTGTLPDEIGNLTALQQLDLSWNNIEGSLPATIGNLKNLDLLAFTKNKLSGDIPTAITTLPCWTTNGWSNVIQQESTFTFSTLNLSVPDFTQADLMTSTLVNSTSVMKEKELTLIYGWRSDTNFYLPTLKQLYQHYKNHGLNIIGVNMDNEESVARAAITKNGMEGWHHVTLTKLNFGNWLSWIPTVALFDKTGKLLFYNFYQDVERDLPAIIKEKLGEGETLYASTDFSKDGTYETLQTASEGNGINIVLMGDAYSDRLIADGTYRSVMEKAYNAFFSEQPYTDFQHLFNVYYVNVVSANEEYWEGKANTALSGWFGESTYVAGDDDKCIEYAEKIPAITEANIDNTLIIVMMNSPRYAGTCYMSYSPNWTTDYGEGNAIAYFPVGESDEDLANVLHHEAGGHGFGKLDDEYFYDDVPTNMEKEKNTVKQLTQLGWYKNIDITNNKALVHWSKFISDTDYAAENIGVYEGAHTYAKGFYRPTDTSIMRDNIGGFNAPSREIIYYRIHKLAYGEDWTYNYNEFKRWDAKNIHSHATYRSIPKNFVPLAPPVVTRK